MKYQVFYFKRGYHHREYDDLHKAVIDFSRIDAIYSPQIKKLSY